MAKITFPETLVRAANLPARELNASGSTIKAAIEACCEQHVDLRGHLFYPNGDFKNHFLVTMNDEHCKIEEAANENDQIDILMAIENNLSFLKVFYDKNFYIQNDNISLHDL